MHEPSGGLPENIWDLSKRRDPCDDRKLLPESYKERVFACQRGESSNEGSPNGDPSLLEAVKKLVF
jgi:hypothetical protein